MLTAFSTPENKRRTVLLLAVSAAAAGGAALLGLDDNPPGLLLAFLSVTAFGTACVHPWSSAASFRRLSYASAAGFVVAAVLHNAFHAIASVPGLPSLAHWIFVGAGVLFFFFAILVCPPLFLVGVVGALVRWVESKES